MLDAGARHNPSSVTLKVLCNKEENLSYCCPVITIDWQCNMHWMHEIFTGQWNQVCCHEHVFKCILARLSLMVGVALKQTQFHNWRHLDHHFFATFLAPKISIPNCLPSNIPVLPLLSQCPLCTIPSCLPSKKTSKLTMGIYQQLLIRLKARLTHLHLTGSPTFANALNCQDDRSAVIDFSAAGF